MTTKDAKARREDAKKRGEVGGLGVYVASGILFWDLLEGDCMGLDGVEIVMEVEDRFGITIPNEIAASILTVGQLSDYIVSAMLETSAACFTQRTFYRLRAGLMQVTGVPRREIRPGGPLEDLLPEKRRQVMWAQLQRATGHAFPRLMRPSWLRGALWLSPSLVIAAVGLSLRVHPSAAALALGLAVATTLVFLALPLARRFPRGIVTVGDLVHSVIWRNRIEDTSSTSSLGAQDVWQIVRQIVAEQMGIRADTIERHSRFIEDLGVG